MTCRYAGPNQPRVLPHRHEADCADPSTCGEENHVIDLTKPDHITPSGVTVTWLPRCEWSDLPVYECDHCPADARQAAEVAASRLYRAELGPNTSDVISGPQNATSRSGRNLWPTVPTPASNRQPLHLGTPDDDTCACGQPVTDNAVACGDCIDEMERILGVAPWLAEQLDIAITGQRAKRPNSQHGDDPLPWNDAASVALHELRNELSTTIRALADDHHLEQPEDTIDAMSRWLLTNTQRLAHHDAWTDSLRNLRRIEGDTLRIVDNPPARLFLGYCTAPIFQGEGTAARIETCEAPIYARDGQPTGRCSECHAEYDVATSRQVLTDALDDQLVTAAEIARLAVYLGLEQPRERVRKAVNSWHRHDRLTAKGSRDGAPTFRFGEARVLLAATYQRRDDRSA